MVHCQEGENNVFCSVPVRHVSHKSSLGFIKLADPVISPTVLLSQVRNRTDWLVQMMVSVVNNLPHYNQSSIIIAPSKRILLHRQLIVRIHDLESQLGDPDHPQNLINCSPYHCRAIPKISSKSTNNLLSNGQISHWTLSIVIRITTKI